MAGKIEARLAELGIELPVLAVPQGNYVPTTVTGNLVFTAGQIPLEGGKAVYVGKLGVTCDIETAQKAARLCALNILAAVKKEIGDLDRITRIVKLVGFVNSAPDFIDQPKVINGASDLFGQVFGEAGRHARSAVGAAVLPLGVPVEVEAIIEFK